MKLFELFGATKAPHTALQAFLAKLTPEQALTTYRSVKDERLRLPSAISSAILFMVNKFVAGYAGMQRDTCKAAHVSAPAVPFDAMAFESAAYIHYWVMKGELRDGDGNDEGGDDEEGMEESTDDPYLACLKSAAFVTDSLLQSYTSFPIAKQFFMNRVISYSANTSPSELFLRVLLSTQEQGVPGPVKRLGIPRAQLPQELAAISYVGIFHKSYLESFPTNIEKLYEAEQAGLL